MTGDLVALLLMTGIIFVLGKLLHLLIARNSAARRLHGWYVLAGSTFGYVAAGLYALREGLDSHGVGGAAWFGLLSGLALGSIAGVVALRIERSMRDKLH